MRRVDVQHERCDDIVLLLRDHCNERFDVVVVGLGSGEISETTDDGVVKVQELFSVECLIDAGVEAVKEGLEGVEILDVDERTAAMVQAKANVQSTPANTGFVEDGLGSRSKKMSEAVITNWDTTVEGIGDHVEAVSVHGGVGTIREVPCSVRGRLRNARSFRGPGIRAI